jgi:hypothetical protein
MRSSLHVGGSGGAVELLKSQQHVPIVVQPVSPVPGTRFAVTGSAVSSSLTFPANAVTTTSNSQMPIAVADEDLNRNGVIRFDIEGLGA